MPIELVSEICNFHSEATTWRRHMHERPELLYDLDETAAFVEARLREFGIEEIATGIAKTGIVAVIEGQSNSSGMSVGLRADMDALPILERTGLNYDSKYKGRMHACGHDGHTAMLLAAARHLSATRNFDGSAVLIFQPAEEGAGGGRAMIGSSSSSRRPRKTGCVSAEKISCRKSYPAYNSQMAKRPNKKILTTHKPPPEQRHHQKMRIAPPAVALASSVPSKYGRALSIIATQTHVSGKKSFDRISIFISA